MKATFLREIPTARSVMEVFGGYDHRARIAEGSLFDECNLSSRDYPVMSTRRGRIKLADIEGLQGVHVKDSVAWVANGRLFYDGQEVPELILSEGEKQMVSMGSRIIIYPDMVSYDTVKGVYESARASVDEYTVTPIWTHGGKNTDTAKRYSDLPNGYPLIYSSFYEQYVEDKSYIPAEGSWAWTYRGNKVVYYQYLLGKFVPETSDMLTIRINMENVPRWGEDNRATEDEVNEFLRLKGATGDLRFFNKQQLSQYIDVPIESIHYKWEYYNPEVGIDSYFVEIKIKFERAFTEEEFLDSPYVGWSIEWSRISRFDGILENGNRLWGWRYGENIQGDFVNEIYASEMGNPSAWQTFEGTNADSYSVSVGSDGPFTGAAYWGGSLYFFKETCFHRVMGSLPSNYQLTTVSCYGVEQGSERSLVVTGDAMYYKGMDGIYRYDGSIPYKISDVFGDKKYKNAVGGVLGDCVFFDMETEDGGRVIAVYDTAKKLWHMEDGIGATCFVTAYGNLMVAHGGGLMLMSDKTVDEVLMRLFGDSLARERDFSWFAEFGDFGLSDPDAKYVSKLLLRMTVDEGARMTVEVMCDSDGSWRTAAVVSAKNKKSWCLPVVTPRCDHFRLRLSGVGGFKLWTLTRETESTNEVRA